MAVCRPLSLLMVTGVLNDTRVFVMYYVGVISNLFLCFRAAVQTNHYLKRFDYQYTAGGRIKVLHSILYLKSVQDCQCQKHSFIIHLCSTVKPPFGFCNKGFVCLFVF